MSGDVKSITASAGRNPYLDYLRGISAILVMMFHYTARYDMLIGHVGNYPLVIGHGSYAVLMFFLLSGYLTFQGLSRYTPKKFVKNRFFRLYPTYWLCMVVTMVLVTLFLPELTVSKKDFLLNFSMLQMYLGGKSVDGAYWTLACEVLFYVLILAVCIFKWNKYAVQIILCWAVVQIGLTVFPDSGYFALVKKFNRLLYFHCFMAGGVVSVMENRIRNGKKIDAINVALTMCLALFVGLQFLDHEVSSGVFMAFSVAFLFASVIAFNKWGGVKPLIQKILSPITWVASISYPLYLLHQNIGYIIIQKMEAIGLINEVFLIIPIIIIMFFAWLVHHFVETPLQRMSKR